MVDIHTHIIPAVDDGSENPSESLLMLRTAFDSGVRKIIMTPHYLNAQKCRARFDEDYIRNEISELQTVLRENGIGIELFCGAENYAVDTIDEIAADKKLIPLNGTDYVLIEFPFDDDFDRAKFCAGSILKQGYIPVIAHPERYIFTFRDPEPLFWFKKNGCLLQVNKGSGKGKFGNHPMMVARFMFENGLVDFVASDAHGAFNRTTSLQDEFEWIAVHYGVDAADLLLDDNPEKLLSNLDIRR